MSGNIRRGRGRRTPLTPTEEESATTPTPTPSSAPPPQKAAHSPLVLDDLEALAKMDPTELAALMDGSFGQKPLEPGAKVSGPVTRVGRSHVFVDIGGKSEGAIDRSEVPDAKLGDTIEAYVLVSDDLGVSLSRQLSGAAAETAVEDAFASGEPVDGVVTKRNRGGFEVRIGSVRAFCPASRVSRVPVADPDSLIGQTLAFRVIETGDKTVLDRRVMQEEEVAEQAVEIWASIQPGDTHAGVVRNVRDFGAFVDIGGVDGLVPRSEIGWSRGADPREVLQVGQRVEVTVLEVDGARKRLTLSCKTAENDPWQAVGLSIAEGGTYEGSVARVEDFGAFVELSAGVTGLLHVSRASGALPAPGETVSVRVTGIDHERRRLELSSTDVTSTGPAAEPPPAARVSGSVVQVLRNGVAITLEDGRSAWLPAAQVELPAGTMLAQRFRRGRRVEARVLKMDRERVVLTMRDDADGGTQSWRQHLSQRSGSRGQGSGAGFGTLGDLLKGLKKD